MRCARAAEDFSDGKNTEPTLSKLQTQPGAGGDGRIGLTHANAKAEAREQLARSQSFAR